MGVELLHELDIFGIEVLLYLIEHGLAKVKVRRTNQSRGLAILEHVVSRRRRNEFQTRLKVGERFNEYNDGKDDLDNKVENATNSILRDGGGQKQVEG